MSIAPNATEERPQALGRVFRHEFARALAYLRLGAIPAYIVAYFGIRRVFRGTGRGVLGRGVPGGHATARYGHRAKDARERHEHDTASLRHPSGQSP